MDIQTRDVLKTTAEFAACALIPPLSIGVGIYHIVAGNRDYKRAGEINEHTAMITGIADKSLIKPAKEQFFLREDEKVADTKEMWKGIAEIFWIPGMLTYAVVSFIKQFLDKQKTVKEETDLVDRATDQIDQKIPEKMKEIQDLARINVYNDSKFSKKTLEALNKLLTPIYQGKNSIWPLDDIEREKFNNILRESGKTLNEPAKDSLLKQFYSLTKLDEEKDVVKAEAYYNAIKGELSTNPNDTSIKSLIDKVKNLEARKVELKAIKESVLDEKVDLDSLMTPQQAIDQFKELAWKDIYAQIMRDLTDDFTSSSKELSESQILEFEAKIAGFVDSKKQQKAINKEDLINGKVDYEFTGKSINENIIKLHKYRNLIYSITPKNSKEISNQIKSEFYDKLSEKSVVKNQTRVAELIELINK